MEWGNEELVRLEKVSHIGDAMQAFVNGSGGLEVLETYILTPLEKKAFETFKQVNPVMQAEVIQTQMMSKVIDQIRQEIQIKIEEGRLAADSIINSTQEDE